MILMTSIWSFLTFDYIWVLTQGGPAGASEVLSVLVFKNAFMNLEAGYASAIGLTHELLRGHRDRDLHRAAAAWMGDLMQASDRTWRSCSAEPVSAACQIMSCSSLLAVFALGPLVILAFNSVKSQAEIGRNPLGFPREFIWQQLHRSLAGRQLFDDAPEQRHSGTLITWPAYWCWAGWRPTAWPS